jgi:hypothetical protein
MAATGSFAAIIAYAQGQTDDSELTTFEEAMAPEETTTAANATDQTNETTTTASAAIDSACTPVMTAEDGANQTVTSSLNVTGGPSTGGLNASDITANETTTATIGAAENATATAGLNDSQTATLDALIENACDAIRDGKSVTALGFLATAQDVLNNAETGTETAAQTEANEVEDVDEPNDVDVGEEEDVDLPGEE